MKMIKVLLSSMFVFTAVIKSAEVGICGTRHHSYHGVKANFDILNDNGTVVSHSYQCGTNWPEIKDGIQKQLREMQEQINEDQVEIREENRLKKVAKELVGVEVQGE